MGDAMRELEKEYTDKLETQANAPWGYFTKSHKNCDSYEGRLFNGNFFFCHRSGGATIISVGKDLPEAYTGVNTISRDYVSLRLGHGGQYLLEKMKQLLDEA